MDMLHNVSAMQPEELDVHVEPDFDDGPDVALENCFSKFSQLTSRSTTCTQGMLDDISHGMHEDIGTQTFNSWYSEGTRAVDEERAFPPNRLLHTYHTERMQAFMQAGP